MLSLRLLLLAGCLSALTLSAATARWEGRLARGNHTWILDLGRHPVWRLPPPPDYEQFHHEFERFEDFPPPQGCTITLAYHLDKVALEAMLYLWPVTGLCGLLYVTTRGPGHDIVLHCAASLAAGLTLAIVACIGLWCVVGGWGPPAPTCFGAFGLVGGMARGIASFPRARKAGQTPIALSVDQVVTVR